MADTTNKNSAYDRNFLRRYEDASERIERAAINMDKASRALSNAQKSSGTARAIISGIPQLSKFFDDSSKRTAEAINELAEATDQMNKMSERYLKKGREKYSLDENKVKNYDDLIKKLNELLKTYKESLAQKLGIDPKDLDERIKDEKTIKNLTADQRDDYDKICTLQKDIVDYSNVHTEQLRAQKDLIKARGQAIKEGVSEIYKSFEGIYNFGSKILSTWGKISQAASKFAKEVGAGYHGMVNARKGAIEMVARGSFAARYGVNAEKLLGLESAYSTQTGRKVAIGRGDLEAGSAMSALLGGDTGKTAQIASEYQKFGVSMEAAGTAAGRMFKEAGKYGLNFQTYSNNVYNNLRMAQRLTFKNGLRGLEEMAKKATSVRLDMQQVANMADKINEGGIQGVVEMGANLQVLGGPFAAFSNPLQILNEGLNDVGSLVDRVTKMVGNLGYFNENTGQFDMGTFNRLRLRSASKALGINYDQLVDTALAQSRLNWVRGKLSGSGFNEEDLNFIANTANVKNGKAMLSWYGKNGERIERDATTITKREFEEFKLQNQSESDDIKTIAVMLRGWDDVITGRKEQLENEKARAVEATGIGEKVMEINKWVGQNNAVLNAILGVMTFYAAGSFFKGLSKGGGLLSAGRGTKISGGGGSGGTGGVGGTAAGSVASSKVADTGRILDKNGKLIGYKGKKHTWTEGSDGLFRSPTSNKTFTETQVKNWGPKVYQDGTAVNQASGNIFKRAGNWVKGFGKSGAGKALGGIGRLAGKIGGGAGILGVIGELGTDQLVASGKFKRGGFGDYAGNILSRAASFGSTGAMIGSLLGPIGTGIGAAVGAVVGGISGAVKATKHKREEDIKRLTGGAGVAENVYTARQLRNIKKALRTGDYDLLSDKLIKKMEEHGDQGVLDAIAKGGVKSDKITAESLYVNRIEGLPEYAKGGVVPGAPGKAQIAKIHGGETIIPAGVSITPRPVDAKVVFPGVQANAKQVIEHKVGDSRITLNVEGNTPEARQLSAMLVDELRRNPQSLQSLSSAVEKQIGINYRDANLVGRYTYGS